MPREKFLQQVADYYVKNTSARLTDYIFVFPNRRSAMSMRKYMQDAFDKPHFMPKMMSITDFTQQYNTTALAKPTELTFILYQAYCNVLKRHGREDQITDFDRFYFWGSILLNDFNDIDAYLVDAHQLYSNIKGIKDINANYLTEDQLEVAKYLWGNDIYQDDETLWKPKSDEGDGDASKKFIKLWMIMGELYDEFHVRLKERPTPLAYTGMQSRTAYETIKAMGVDDFHGKKYVFVGFNILSTARICIFDRLKQLGIAEFFWDTASPFFDDKDQSNSVGKIINELKRKFPSPQNFDLLPIDTKPEIEVMSVPSNFGQTKVASSILKEWIQELKPEGSEVLKEEIEDTAIVMADERLLMPMLFSIPPDIEAINITMGVSYSDTSFASLMSSIISMHLHVWKRIDGDIYYYYKDVVDILSHPHIVKIAPKESQELKDKIINEHQYNIGAKWIDENYQSLTPVFQQIQDQNDILYVRKYIDGLISWLRTNLESIANTKKNHREFYELKILESYAKSIDELCALIETYEIKMQERTFLQMIERTMVMTPINLIGKPIKGLQIMSVMDTRALDFNRLIMTSLNERIFPKRNYTPSMIPMVIRTAYLMPTQEHEEMSYAYQFYRLISRAKKVKLLYDSRTGGITSGEPSRYISQLLHLNDKYPVKYSSVEFSAKTEKAKPMQVDKNPEVMAQLNRYLAGGDRALSASALKVYNDCPLQFYLRFVKHMKCENNSPDFIDAASYGSVIHKVVQKLYNRHKGKTINEETLRMMQQENLEQSALKTLNEKYYKNRYAEDLSRMPGEGQIIAKLIAEYVFRMLEKEKASTPFVFVGAEVFEYQQHEWRINDKYTVRFTMSIDRIDKFRPNKNEDVWAFRFIDYKTGSDALKVPKVDDLFNDHSAGGIFQLLVYCHAYADIFRYTGGIKPIIYKFQTVATEGLPDLQIGSVTLDDYLKAEHVPYRKDKRYPDRPQFQPSFREKLEELIDKIFETENKYPFTQAEDIEKCRYCPFTQICGRNVPEKNNNY